MNISKLLLAALTALYLPMASADMSVRSDNNSLILVNAPCPSPIRDQLKPEYADKFQFAYMLRAGIAMEACWVRATPETVFIWVNDEDGLELPWSIFKEDNGV